MQASDRRPTPQTARLLELANLNLKNIIQNVRYTQYTINWIRKFRVVKVHYSLYWNKISRYNNIYSVCLYRYVIDTADIHNTYMYML